MSEETMNKIYSILKSIETIKNSDDLIEFTLNSMIDLLQIEYILVFENDSFYKQYTKNTLMNEDEINKIISLKNLKSKENETYFFYELKNGVTLCFISPLNSNVDAISIIILQLNLKIENLTLQEKIESNQDHEQTKNKRLTLIENILLKTKDGIQVADVDGNLVYINKEVSERLGISVDAVSNYKVSDFEPLFKDELNWKKHIDVIKKEGVIVIESINYHVGSRKQISVELIVSMLEIDGNEYVIAASRNIDERIAKQNELLESKIQAEEIASFKDEFIANISHEIRTPLNGILGLSRELSKHNLTEETQELIKHIHASGNFLSSIINNVLDISKINNGNFDIQIEEIDLNQIISQIKSIILPQTTEKGISFSISIAPDINTELYTDEICLKQILINVLHNSVKFTKKGTITLVISNCDENPDKEKNCLSFTISDTGIGMNQEFIPRIFDKFTQEASTEKIKNQGTGLGMSITKELIEKLGGKIAVTSIKNKGTSFKISIPFTKRKVQIQHIEKPEIGGTNLYGKKILIVDDNPINRLVVKSSLRKFENKISECENGAEALDFLKNKASVIDLILMDIQMPIMDGFEASKKIREELNLTIPIVGLTANSLHFSKENYKSHGMNECIFKPYDESSFIQTLSSILQHKETSSFFDLNHLKKITYDDNSLFNEIITLFHDAIPLEINKLENQILNLQFEDFKKTIHKIKPNIHTFRISEIIEDIDYLNQIDQATFVNPNTKERTFKVIRVLEKVRDNLKSNLILL